LPPQPFDVFTVFRISTQMSSIKVVLVCKGFNVLACSLACG
jgi:hypothetical protein